MVNGPYKLVEAVAEDRYVLERNDGYFDAGSVEIPRITFFVVRGRVHSVGDVRGGRTGLHRVDTRRASWTASAEDDVLGPEYYNGPRFIVYYYFFNVAKPPFNQVLVRKAFAAALDKDTVTGRITRGGEVPAGTMTPPGSTGHVANEVGHRHPVRPGAGQGVAGGRQDIRMATGLPEIELGYNASQLHQNIAQAIQKMWQDTLGANGVAARRRGARLLRERGAGGA